CSNSSPRMSGTQPDGDSIAPDYGLGSSAGGHRPRARGLELGGRSSASTIVPRVPTALQQRWWLRQVRKAIGALIIRGEPLLIASCRRALALAPTLAVRAPRVSAARQPLGATGVARDRVTEERATPRLVSVGISERAQPFDHPAAELHGRPS